MDADGLKFNSQIQYEEEEDLKSESTETAFLKKSLSKNFHTKVQS